MNGNQIRAITDKGISYLDDEGQEQFIDFETCYQNYLQHWMSVENLQQVRDANNYDDEAMKKFIERRKQWKEVGKRNILEPSWADGPFIEFHTDPPIRFKFAEEEEFRTVKEAILRAGWRTTDLS